MSRRLENAYPLILAFIAGTIYFIWFRRTTVPVLFKELLSSVVSISAISAGFLATAKSILFSMEKKRILQQLGNESRLYELLIQYLMSAITWSFLSAIISGFYMLFDWTKQEAWHSYLFGAWIVMVVLTSALCFRVIHILGRMLRIRQ